MSTSDSPTLIQPHDPLVINQEAYDKASPMSSGESKDGSERNALRTPPSDTTVSDYQPVEMVESQTSNGSYNMEKLLKLFSEDILAKTLRVAIEALENNVHIQPQCNLCLFSNFSFIRIRLQYIPSSFRRKATMRENIFCATQIFGRVASFLVFYISCENAQSNFHKLFRTSATKMTTFLFQLHCCASDLFLCARTGLDL